MRESKIEKWYCDELTKWGVRHIKLQTRGWPDQLFLANGLPCFVEFKSTGEDVTDPHQRNRIAILKRDGFTVFEINEKSEEWLKKILHALNIRAKL